ncbi:MAG TPA: tRNA (guanosine(37)-N1)-methyltransferase TrmD [Nitrospiraceae bacterium]|nr:tRNA (guanosine(37)-N1)-methyltransferase TrmD [Nitrospiraceae bacterium]
MRCDIITLFPEMILPVLGQSILKRAQDKGLLKVDVHNLRDYTQDRHRVADDTPYGGGAGMVIKAEPVLRAIDAIRQELGTGEHPIRILIPSPQGQPFTQQMAEEFQRDSRRIVFICGHYEGFDERVRVGLNAEEVSIGDYVVTNGELPALVILDAAVRLIPGVLGDPDSALQDSFVEALLDCPHYTRPPEVRGMTVPDVLLSGNHEAIRRWRRKEALRNTYVKRPELLQDRLLSQEDRRLLDEVLQEILKRPSVLCVEEECP